MKNKILIYVTSRKKDDWDKNLKKSNITQKKKIFADIKSIYQQLNNPFFEIDCNIINE